MDCEGGADAGLGVADEDAPFVVLFDDAFGQGEAETPSAFFGGIAGIEYRLLAFARYASAGIGHGDAGFLPLARGCYGNRTCPVHGVDSILYQVFKHPFE